MNHLLISNRRKLIGLSQAELAEAAGLTRETVNRFEKHGGDIGLGTFSRLLSAVGMKMTFEPIDEIAVADWDAFQRDRQNQLLAKTRQSASAEENLRKSMMFDGAKAKVLDWGRDSG